MKNILITFIIILLCLGLTTYILQMIKSESFISDLIRLRHSRGLEVQKPITKGNIFANNWKNMSQGKSDIIQISPEITNNWNDPFCAHDERDANNLKPGVKVFVADIDYIEKKDPSKDSYVNNWKISETVQPNWKYAEITSVGEDNNGYNYDVTYLDNTDNEDLSQLTETNVLKYRIKVENIGLHPFKLPYTYSSDIYDYDLIKQKLKKDENGNNIKIKKEGDSECILNDVKSIQHYRKIIDDNYPRNERGYKGIHTEGVCVIPASNRDECLFDNSQKRIADKINSGFAQFSENSGITEQDYRFGGKFPDRKWDSDDNICYTDQTLYAPLNGSVEHGVDIDYKKAAKICDNIKHNNISNHKPIYIPTKKVKRKMVMILNEIRPRSEENVDLVDDCDTSKSCSKTGQLCQKIQSDNPTSLGGKQRHDFYICEPCGKTKVWRNIMNTKPCKNNPYYYHGEQCNVSQPCKKKLGSTCKYKNDEYECIRCGSDKNFKLGDIVNAKFVSYLDSRDKGEIVNSDNRKFSKKVNGKVYYFIKFPDFTYPKWVDIDDIDPIIRKGWKHPNKKLNSCQKKTNSCPGWQSYKEVNTVCKNRYISKQCSNDTPDSYKKYWWDPINKKGDHICIPSGKSSIIIEDIKIEGKKVTYIMRNRGNKDYSRLKSNTHGAYGAIHNKNNQKIDNSKYNICLATWNPSRSSYDMCLNRTKRFKKYTDNTFLEPKILKNQMIRITIEFDSSVSESDILSYKIVVDNDNIVNNHRGNKSYSISQ